MSVLFERAVGNMATPFMMTTRCTSSRSALRQGLSRPPIFQRPRVKARSLWTRTPRESAKTASQQLQRSGVTRPYYGGAAALTLLVSSFALVRPLNNTSDSSDEIRSQDEEEGEITSGNEGTIAYQEVEKHNSADDCWVVINGQVYNLTQFIASHPGGQQAIIDGAGTDVSQQFSTLHPPDALKKLKPEWCLGPVDLATLPEEEERELTEAELAQQAAREEMPPVERMHLLQDFESWAERVLSDTAWAYYRSATDEERTFFENRDAFRRYFFRPRILTGKVTDSTTETEFVGIKSSLPIFIAPAAMAKLGHPLGEVNLTKAAGAYGIVQAISCNASCGLDEIFEARINDQQPLIFQLYLNKDRSASETLIKKVEALGARAIIFTVDVSGDSKRTMDVRTKTPSKSLQLSVPGSTSSIGSSAPAEDVPVGRAISGYQERDLGWKDISFIRGITKLPLIIKGVQSLEDVQLCVDNGVDGVILSNHGGRQADYAPAPIDVLYEIRTLRPDLFSKTQIMIDGGIRCGADVVKCLALGAKAVGLGRAFLYANGTHGEEGCKRIIEILHEEITNTMRNIGVTRIQDLKPELVGPAGPWIGLNRPAYMALPMTE